MRPKKISVNGDVYDALEAICKPRDISVSELVRRLTVFPNLAERLIDLGDSVTDQMKINAIMADKMLPILVDQLGENMSLIRHGKSPRDLPIKKDTPALVIGAGPSLQRTKQLELLVKKPFKGVIFVVDRAISWCLESGLVPDYMVILDGSEKIFKYIDYPIVDEYSDRITAIMCASTHPSVVNRWKGDICWFSTAMDEVILPNVSLLMGILTNKPEVATAGHASSLAWSIAVMYPCNPIVLVGVDLSYPMDFPIDQTWYYSMYRAGVKSDDEVWQFYKKYHHNVFNTDCYYDMNMFAGYLKTSLEHIDVMHDAGIRVINCTEGGALEAEYLDCMKLEDYLNMEQK